RRVASPAEMPIVAVIDRGIDTSHPDFSDLGGTSTNVKEGGQINGGLSVSMISIGPSAGSGSAHDDLGHGTWVSGIIAAAGNNGRYPGRTERGFGVIGVGYNAQIAALKVADASGNGDDNDVIAAILFAADHGAMVLNMSL